MRPDLRLYNATYLTFYLALPLTSKVISDIQRISPPDSEGDCLFSGDYVRHKAWAWVYGAKPHRRNSSDLTSIQFVFRPGRASKPLKDAPRVEQLVGLLSSIDGQVRIACQVDFQFGRRLKPKALNLPMKISEAPDVPFNSLVGVHLARRDGKEVTQDVRVDVDPSGVVTTTVAFRFNSAIDENTASRILEEATAISKHLVSTEKSHGG